MTRTNTKITCKEFFVLWFSGLRGAMAYALALSSAVDFPTVGPVILIDTLCFSLVTILIQGSIMNPVLSKCDVKQKPELPGQENDITGTSQNWFNRFKLRVRNFDNSYFAPLFIKS
jgi:NhaP-type Na+/H+ or K+/H+ antiporter